jgi:hypothetical protein
LTILALVLVFEQTGKREHKRDLNFSAADYFGAQ